MPTVGNSVKFKFGSQQEFDAIINKDNDTLYFTTDTLILYQGNQRYSKRTKYGTSSPDGSVEGVEGDLYVQVGGDVATGVPFWYYNGTSWVELFRAQTVLGFTPPKTVNSTGNGEDVKTTIRLIETNGSVDKTPSVINNLINNGFDVKLVLSQGKISSSVSGPITLNYYTGDTSYTTFSGLYVESGSVVAVYSTVDTSKNVTTVTNSFITVVDSELSSTSTHPVQNKVIKKYVDDRTVVDSTLSSTSTHPVQNKVIKKYVDDRTVVDSTLSSTSTHPVQNKVIKAELDKKFDKTGGTISGNVYISPNGEVPIYIGGQIGFETTNGKNGAYFCMGNRSPDLSKPVITFYGREGDEPVAIAHIEDPTEDYDAANKQYVDNAVASAGMTHPIVLQKDTDYGDALPTNPVEGQLFLQNATSGLPIEQGGTGATNQSDALANLKALPLAGGTMDADSKITHPGNVSSWTAGLDKAILRRPNSVSDSSVYYPLVASKTVAGHWTMGTYNNQIQFNYISDADSSRKIFLFDDDGNMHWTGGKELLVNGTLGANASSILRANFNGNIFKNLIVLMRSANISNVNRYNSFVFPTIANDWGILLPAPNNNYFSAKIKISGSGSDMSCTLQMDSNGNGVIGWILATA